MSKCRTAFLGFVVATGLVGLRAIPGGAHCDGLDGPVVEAAREALAKNDVNRVLVWVRLADEPEIRRAFERTLRVRKLGGEAQALADTYFFETLVRIHRAGEGAPFTGLAPAGRDLGPAIPAADRALESGDVAPLADLLVEEVRTGVAERFGTAVEARKRASQDVHAGRESVHAYVAFVHYAEGVHEAATRRVEGHFPDEDIAPRDSESHAHPEHRTRR